MSETADGPMKWRPRKMKPIKPKDVVTEVYHKGTLIDGVQKTKPMMTLPPQNWQPWEGGG